MATIQPSLLSLQATQTGWATEPNRQKERSRPMPTMAPTRQKTQKAKNPIAAGDNLSPPAGGSTSVCPWARPSRTCRWRRRYPQAAQVVGGGGKRRREDGEACRGARRALCDAQWRYQRALRERLVGRKATAGRQLALERQRRWCVRSVAMRLLRRRYGAWWRRG